MLFTVIVTSVKGVKWFPQVSLTWKCVKVVLGKEEKPDGVFVLTPHITKSLTSPHKAVPSPVWELYFV